MARHFSGRTRNLWTCYECKTDRHDACSDTANTHLEDPPVCHCATCTRCTVDHGVTRIGRRRPDRFVGTTLTEMGY